MEDYLDKVLLQQYPLHIELAAKELELEPILVAALVLGLAYLKQSYFDIVVVNFEFVVEANLNFRY